MINFSERLPEMLFGDQLKQALTCLPYYDVNVKQAAPGNRLLKLTDIYKVFLPGAMATEIYHKLYMMTSMSLSQKGTSSSIKLMNANHKWVNGGEFQGVATGATSATVIGCSGIGKSTCIRKAMNLLGDVIEVENPHWKLIPVLMVSTPFDCNYKGLLCQILIAVDEVLQTKYYEKSQKSTMNAQQILGMVSQVCHQFVGTLIIDEIQFIVQHKAGEQLYRMILQMINTSCNILLVGTNECLPFFTQNQNAFQMARRSVGLQYSFMEYNSEFRHLCEVLFGYQYVAKESYLTDGITSWLYEHTSGNPSTLVSLIHDAQEIAILDGTELLGLESMTKAYNERLQMLHGYINPSITKKAQTGSSRRKSEAVRMTEIVKIPETTFAESEDSTDAKITTVDSENQMVENPMVAENHIVGDQEYQTIAQMASKAKAEKLDMIPLLKMQFQVLEVEL